MLVHVPAERASREAQAEQRAGRWQCFTRDRKQRPCIWGGGSGGGGGKLGTGRPREKGRERGRRRGMWTVRKKY